MNKSQTFDGVRQSAGAAREFVAQVLDETGFTETETARLIVSELVTNSVEHSRSGLDSGSVTVTVAVLPCHYVRIEVRDGGPADGLATIIPAAEPSADVESGRGLFLVDLLSASWSYDGRGLWTARLAWNPVTEAAPAASDTGALFALPQAGGAW